uniref:Uncharacterized protein n=1 Tax=Ignisphaera aggregans TaxID=334771 RepID=A0A7J3MYX6_9CREN
MNRASFVRRVRTVVPLIGIPIKGCRNTYVSTIINHECIMRASYRFVRCSIKALDNGEKVHQGSVTNYINEYMNMILSELLDMCMNGELSIECPFKVPDIVLFVIGTTELLLNTFKTRKLEYKDYQHIFAALDRKFWSIDIENAYLYSLRCAYMNKATCVCRDVYDVINFEPVDIDLEFIYENKCHRDLCLELENPYDNVTTTYMLKFVTHVVSKMVQDLNSFNYVSKSIEKYLKLLYDIEVRTALENIEGNATINLFNIFVKPVADISTIKIYKLRLKYLEREV